MSRLASLALVAKAGKFDSRTLYAGWTDAGLPVLTNSTSDLSDDASDQAKTFLNSDYPIPTLPLRRQLDVVAVEFAGPVQDLEDPSPDNLVQDTIKVTVKNTSGKEVELTLGELDVLGMIGNNMMVFQRFGSILDTAERQKAVPYFSFFLPGNDDRQDLLVLMHPTNENLGNLIDAIIFIQDVIRKLLMNDEHQAKQFKKGYLTAGQEAEQEINKELQKSHGMFSFLFVPEDTPDPLNTLGKMIVDFVSVPTDGSKPTNPLTEPVKKVVEVAPDRKTLDRLRLTAAKMYLYAKSRIRTR